ncbi:hypothetical protein BGP_4483 [Beggiatoa sp. PS]|nr:hypothetical protein BGP_4483 [Beggiatoa sp. PS]
MESLKKRLGAALKAVTPSICKNTFQHVRKEENYYWKVDEEIDNISKP